MTLSPRFNLWTDPWIRVIRGDGGDDEVSIGDCLVRAHELAVLSDPSPLVVGGTQRLLAAILQAIYQPGDVGDIAALLGAGRFDEARLRQFERDYAARFDLFHPEAPFLQTGDVPLDGYRKPEKGRQRAWGDPQPVARLFAEVPVATERTHFNHVTDEGHRLCPACCARGLVTVPAFVSSGGSGMHPSINGMPPIYVLPAGDNLFETLALSLISRDLQPRTADPGRGDQAIWTSDPPVVNKDHAVEAVGYLESLTFPARRMRLYPHTGSTLCTHCGRPAAVFVTHMLFEMGHWLNKEAGIWDDPFVAFRNPQGRARSSDAGPRPVRPEAGKALWREYANLLLEEDEAGIRPRVVRQVSLLIERRTLAERQELRFRCIGVRTDGKAKIFEWLDEALEAPPAVLTDPDAAGYVQAALEQAHEGASVLRKVFDRHFRPERGGARQDFVRFNSVRERMLADYWQRMGMHFRRFINDLRDPRQRDNAERGWARAVIEVVRPCFNAALDQVGARADALRARVEAESDCERWLYAKRKEWLYE
ncbi:MAG: type I-E CRISPR-associated protein Cse1/CasA [Oscillochloridaceae bacterium]|nr:type I-E CRISPR-associated protein Cse1/CasA [Chloroflexaceae bacterium]MDW8389518.1 type I-E CRISPR-associated protein Cse1/CasA [Oscillochloridaceae bacterium]